MLDPEQTPSPFMEGPALCEVCGDPLPAKRYVHVEARAIDVLCSIECYRFDRRKRRRARWSSRGRSALRTTVAAILTAAFLTPHTERSARRRFAQAAMAPRPTAADAAQPGCRRAGSGPSGPRRTPPRWPPWVTTRGFTRCRGRCGACRAPIRASSARCARGSVRPSAATATAGSTWAARCGASTCTPFTTASWTSSSATPTPIAAASSSGSRITTAPCSRGTSTWRPSRAESSAASTSRADRSSVCWATRASRSRRRTCTSRSPFAPGKTGLSGTWTPSR